MGRQTLGDRSTETDERHRERHIERKREIRRGQWREKEKESRRGTPS